MVVILCSVANIRKAREIFITVIDVLSPACILLLPDARTDSVHIIVVALPSAGWPQGRLDFMFRARPLRHVHRQRCQVGKYLCVELCVELCLWQATYMIVRPATYIFTYARNVRMHSTFPGLFSSFLEDLDIFR